MKELRLVIVDDHPLLRKGLADLLHLESGINVVGEADNGAKALEVIEATAPDIAIVDIEMPIMDGIELVRLLRKHRTKIDIILLTVLKDRTLLRSLASLGVRGYVLKDSAIEEIVDCIRTVASGERYVSPKLERRQSREEPGLNNSSLVGLETLTQSELKILYLVSLSRTSREISEEVNASIRTVETHRYNISSKLELRGTHALLKFAVENKPEILNAYSLRETT